MDATLTTELRNDDQVKVQSQHKEEHIYKMIFFLICLDELEVVHCRMNACYCSSNESYYSEVNDVEAVEGFYRLLNE